jgi:MFS family permease
LFTWIPPYLSLPVSQGGRGFGVMGTTTLLVVLNLFGMFPGYASFGWAADRLGRKRAFICYSLTAAFVIPLYAIARSPVLIMILGAVVAFFGTGLFSGSGIIGSEIFPTSLRARGLGFTYNGARTLSSVSPADYWSSGTGSRIGLGILFVRSRISAGGPDDNATAGNPGKESGVKTILTGASRSGLPGRESRSSQGE